jgi:hypothetical protein
MTYQLLFFDEVQIDVIEAKGWYKKQKEGLEIGFSKEIEISILQLLKTPKSYSIRYKNVRISHPKRFPFNIHFYIDENIKTVVIIAIVHNKKSPSTTSKRIS